MISSIESLVENHQVDAVLQMLLTERGLPIPVREWQFDEHRKYRFDYAFPEQKIAIEVQGGRWMRRGAHNTGHAIARDCNKSNLAQTQGWIVICVFPETLREKHRSRA